MTTYLLDASILIALLDADHVHHEIANQWFEAEGHISWATCPLTENAVLRIVGNPRYVNSPGSPAIVAELLLTLRGLGQWRFWPDGISLVDDVPGLSALNSAQLTDAYLLALAVSQGGKFATLDRRVVVESVPGGRDALFVLP